MSIGKNIKRLRLQHGLSQSDLGKMVGVTDKAVSSWENEISEPKIKAIQIMADKWGLKKSDIIDEQGTPFIDGDTFAYAIELRDSPELQMLVHAAQGVSREDLQVAVEMIKRFKKG